MSAHVSRAGRVRRWAVAAGVGLFAGGPVAAQPGSGLGVAKAYQQVADQKTEDNVRTVIAEADKLYAASPSQAILRLKRELLSLNFADGIGSAKRQQLSVLLEGRIATYQKGAAAAGAPVADPKAVAAAKDKNRQSLEAYRRETNDVREALAEIQKAYTVNNLALAQKRIADITRKYPDNPVVIGLTSQGNYGDRAQDARVMAAEQDKRVVYALNDVQRSSLPATGDIEFPKDWKERTKDRDTNGIKLSPEEEAILQALEKRVGNGLKDAPFLETVQTISNLIGKEIFLDRKSLEDAGLDLQRPVSMPGNVTARTALRAVLQAQGLTWVLKDRIIQVVTLEKAQTLQVTKAYYLGELVSGAGPLPGGAPVWGPVVDYQQTMGNAQVIVESIMQSIDPLIWKPKGGPATITFHYPSLSIIVRAPSEVHASFRGKLSGR